MSRLTFPFSFVLQRSKVLFLDVNIFVYVRKYDMLNKKYKRVSCISNI